MPAMPYKDSEFQTAVKAWVEYKDAARRELCEAFEVSIPIVDRWYYGMNAPHPILQGVILTWIRQRLAR